MNESERETMKFLRDLVETKQQVIELMKLEKAQQERDLLEQKDANAILKQELNSVKSENKELKSQISIMKNEIEIRDESIETLLKEKQELEKERDNFKNELAQKKNESDENNVAIINIVKNVKHQKTINLHSYSIRGLEIFEKRNIKYLVSASWDDGTIKVW